MDMAAGTAELPRVSGQNGRENKGCEFKRLGFSWGRGENREMCKRRGSAGEDSQSEWHEELCVCVCVCSSDSLLSLNKSSLPSVFTKSLQKGRETA